MADVTVMHSVMTRATASMAMVMGACRVRVAVVSRSGSEGGSMEVAMVEYA
jgi:hypothetical protein